MLILTNVSELHKIPITEEAGQRAYKALYYLGQFSKNLKWFHYYTFIQKRRLQLHGGSFDIEDKSVIYVYKVSCFNF